eukprot:GILK01011018.1.p1 GENE.GILK01011018.1~~GILK01011018.1.p1  ORF type:complete len:881 (+),score=145.71 GILK01011018.1:35-2677(+)
MSGGVLACAVHVVFDIFLLLGVLKWSCLHSQTCDILLMQYISPLVLQLAFLLALALYVVNLVDALPATRALRKDAVQFRAMTNLTHILFLFPLWSFSTAAIMSFGYQSYLVLLFVIATGVMLLLRNSMSIYCSSLVVMIGASVLFFSILFSERLSCMSSCVNSFLLFLPLLFALLLSFFLLQDMNRRNKFFNSKPERLKIFVPYFIDWSSLVLTVLLVVCGLNGYVDNGRFPLILLISPLFASEFLSFVWMLKVLSKTPRNRTLVDSWGSESALRFTLLQTPELAGEQTNHELLDLATDSRIRSHVSVIHWVSLWLCVPMCVLAVCVQTGLSQLNSSVLFPVSTAGAAMCFATGLIVPGPMPGFRFDAIWLPGWRSLFVSLMSVSHLGWVGYSIVSVSLSATVSTAERMVVGGFCVALLLLQYPFHRFNFLFYKDCKERISIRRRATTTYSLISSSESDSLKQHTPVDFQLQLLERRETDTTRRVLESKSQNLRQLAKIRQKVEAQKQQDKNHKLHWQSQVTAVAASLHAKESNKWTAGQVGVWLELLGLNHYRTMFEAAGVDGLRLHNITEKQIEELGVKLTSHRVSLVGAIVDLKELDISFGSWEWTHAKVLQWLERKGMKALQDRFIQHAIHGGIMFKYEEEHWREVVGVTEPLLLRSLSFAIERIYHNHRVNGTTHALPPATSFVPVTSTVSQNCRAADWDMSEVDQWLDQITLSHLKSTFHIHGFHGSFLLNITEEELASVIQRPLQVQKVLREIGELLRIDLDMISSPKSIPDSSSKPHSLRFSVGSPATRDEPDSLSCSDSYSRARLRAESNTSVYYTPDDFSTVCSICMSKAISIVLVPCGHACMCDGCASLLDDCPICRTAILLKQKLFRV